MDHIDPLVDPGPDGCLGPCRRT